MVVASLPWGITVATVAPDGQSARSGHLSDRFRVVHGLWALSERVSQRPCRRWRTDAAGQSAGKGSTTQLIGDTRRQLIGLSCVGESVPRAVPPNQHVVKWSEMYRAEGKSRAGENGTHYRFRS